MRQAGKQGIKAIVLYPMNALASDQAGRIAERIASERALEVARSPVSARTAIVAAPARASPAMP